MSTVTASIAIYLNGEPPSGSGLSTLLGSDDSTKAVVDNLRPLMTPDFHSIEIRSLRDFDAVEPEAGTVIVYVIGHGWLDPNGTYAASIRDGAGSSPLTANDLIELLNRCFDKNSRIVLLLDTCQAAALREHVDRLSCRDLTAVFASERGEQAWNLLTDGRTRFSIEVGKALSKYIRAKTEFDVVELAVAVKQSIEKERLGYHQTVTYRVRGDQIRLCALNRAHLQHRRVKTFRRLRNRLILFGGLVVGSLFAAGVFWRGHILVNVSLGDIAKITRDATVQFYEVQGDQNELRLLTEMSPDQGTSVRTFLPAVELLVVFSATYVDGEPRSIRFHRQFQPSLTGPKSFQCIVPQSDEVIKRPGMAFVSAEKWLQGCPTREAPAPPPFWIDIEPPSINEFFPFIFHTYKKGAIEARESMLIWHLMQKGQLSDSDFKSTRTANELLARLRITDTLFADPACPAPMTEREARLFCASRRKFLPKRSQWELAARGIDGRLYPWGNRRVDEWINAGLPKKVGWEGRQKLRPIREHLEAISPFGLIDTVGNAGDWVDDDEVNSDGDAPRGIGFMGGVFQFNVEDCTSWSFMRLPTQESENLPAAGFWMITCRGTIPAQ